MITIRTLVSLCLFGNGLLTFNFISQPLIYPFVFLVLFVSITIIFYRRYYMVGEFNLQYYIILMLVFIRRILLLLTSNSLMIILLRWEGLGVSSFFLIIYYNTWEANINALVTILTMRIGELFLFVWLRYIILTNIMRASLIYHSRVCYLMFIIFTFTKSAQFPYRGWLPKAISAPTPTRALVHSSTLVTAGLMLILFFSERIPSLLILFLLIGGFFTILIGRALTFIEPSIKKVVAYRTISQMGLATMVFGFGNFHLGMLRLVSHGFAKRLLFIQVGYLIHNIINQQNTRLWERSCSVESLMRVQLICTLYSLCGITFFRGIVTKESILKLMVNSPVVYIILVLMVCCVFITFLYRVVLYKVIFSNRAIPVYVHHGSVIILILTYIEVLLVITCFSWTTLNILNGSVSFIYIEGVLPFLILFVVFMGVIVIGNNMFNFNQLNTVLLIATSYQLNRWLTIIFPLKFVEAYLNVINKVLYILCLLSSRKLYFSISVSQFTVLCLLVFMLFN